MSRRSSRLSAKAIRPDSLEASWSPRLLLNSSIEARSSSTDLSRLLNRVFLEFGEIDGPSRDGGDLASQLVLEVFVESLHVDLIRGVFLAAEFRSEDRNDRLKQVICPKLEIPHVPRPPPNCGQG